MFGTIPMPVGRHWFLRSSGGHTSCAVCITLAVLVPARIWLKNSCRSLSWWSPRVFSMRHVLMLSATSHALTMQGIWPCCISRTICIGPAVVPARILLKNSCRSLIQWSSHVPCIGARPHLTSWPRRLSLHVQGSCIRVGGPPEAAGGP